MFDLPAGAARRRAGASPRSTALRDARAARASVGASGAEFIAPRTLDDVRRGAARRPRRAHPRRLDRHRPVGQQDVPRPAAPALHRRGRRAEADRRARRRALDRRRGVARGRVARARRALADARRGLAALRRRAAAPHRHDGRQRRQRLADRRLGAGADGARRDARAAPRRRDAARAARRFLHRLHEEPARAGEFVQAIEVPLGVARPACAPTRSRSASTATSPRSAPAWRSSSTTAAPCAPRDSPSAAWPRRCGARRAPRRRSSARRGTKPPSPPRKPRWRRDFAPLTDMRASAAYRLQVAQNLLRRFWLETRADAPLAASDVERRGARCARCRRPRRAPRRRREPLARSAVAARADGDERGSAPRVGVSLPHESAHLHVAGAAPYVDDLPELAGTLHAALGLSPVAHGRLVAHRSRAHRGDARRRRRAGRRRHPGPNDCGPVDPRRSDPRRRRRPLPRPAGVRGDRRDARRRRGARRRRRRRR